MYGFITLPLYKQNLSLTECEIAYLSLISIHPKFSSSFTLALNRHGQLTFEVCNVKCLGKQVFTWKQGGVLENTVSYLHLQEHSDTNTGPGKNSSLQVSVALSGRMRVSRAKVCNTGGRTGLCAICASFHAAHGQVHPEAGCLISQVSE